jgi:CubicO group peptidase (beta-lactamase class C family)
MNAALIAEAIKAAVENESTAPRDLMIAHAINYGREPYDSPIGPIKSRGPASGLIVHKGYIVAEWGEPHRVDMTYSVTKTFLTTVVGLAWQRGLIRNLDEPARNYMPGGAASLEDGALFEAEHNRTITWDHLLRQTSDWQGTLWGKPDWADRPVGQQPRDWPNRELHAPGTFFKYNDVRINVLALAALHVLRRPLPDVLREEVMEPIGASSGWRWHGYDNAWLELDGKRVQSVTGGGHWGGGMFIDAYDMARFGYLFLRNGKWQEKRIISEDWIQKARTPGRVSPNYGFANWYLNNPVENRKPLPSAPTSAVRFVGNGNNIVYIDWENDVLIVARWVNNDRGLDAIIDKTLAALGSKRK